MEYVISEEELVYFATEVSIARSKHMLDALAIDRIREECFKNKKPVTKIGSGFLYNRGDGHEWHEYAFDSKTSKYADISNNIYEADNFGKDGFTDYFYDQLKGLELDEFKGKNITIYVEVNDGR